MTRMAVTALAVVEAIVTAAVGVALCLTLFGLVWGVQYHFAANFSVMWRASTDTWLVSHGAALRVTLDTQTVSVLGLPAQAHEPFAVTLSLLGLAFLTVLLGARTGFRAAHTPHVVMVVISAVVAFAAASTLLALSAQSAAVSPVLWRSIIFPALVEALGIGLGLLWAWHRGATLHSPRSPFRRALPWRLSPDVRTLLREALRAATAATAIVVGASALVLTVMLFVRYATIIELYEQLHTGAVGGIALTLGQIALIPNLVIWTASWLIGPGFAMGAGTSVSPLGTSVAGVPGLPVFGVVPEHTSPFALIGVVVPILAGFVVAVLVQGRRHAVRRDARTLLSLGIALGVIAGAELGLLAWWSGGALGPGRLSDVGPNPFMVAGIGAAQIACGAVIGAFASRKRDAPR